MQSTANDSDKVSSTFDPSTECGQDELGAVRAMAQGWPRLFKPFLIESPDGDVVETLSEMCPGVYSYGKVFERMTSVTIDNTKRAVSASEALKYMNSAIKYRQEQAKRISDDPVSADELRNDHMLSVLRVTVQRLQQKVDAYDQRSLEDESISMELWQLALLGLP